MAAPTHEAFVDALVLAALDRSTDDFGALVRALPGVFPADVQAALARLAASSAISASMVGRLLASPTTRTTNRLTSDVLPAPHPLDYDWRFDDGTSRWLADVAHGLGGSGPIALLGVPSLVPHIAARAQVIFVDANPQLVAAVRRVRSSTIAVCADIAVDVLPTARSNVVVADPPWYPGHMRAFVWAASQISKPGAVLLLGAPPLAIRPGVSAERRQLITWSRRCGYELSGIEAGRLRYESPLFELNALRAAGVPEVPSDWRMGDLLALRFTRPAVAPRPARPERTEWIDVSLGSSSIRFRQLNGRPSRADPRLRQIVAGDVLPSVSRRDPRRARVAVWTSGNRVFGCEDPELASVITTTIVANGAVSASCESVLGHRLTPAQRRRVAIAAMQLDDLIAAEREVELGRDTAWMRAL